MDVIRDALLSCFREAATTIREQQSNPEQAAHVDREFAVAQAEAATNLERIETGQAAAALRLRSACYKG